MRSLLDPILYTHILFAFNSLLYAIAELYILSLTLFVSTVCSFFYHLFNETNMFWRKSDHLMCFVSLGFIFGYLIVFSTIYNLVGCTLWLLLSLGIYKEGKVDYQFFHTIWHIAVFLGNFFVWYCLI